MLFLWNGLSYSQTAWDEAGVQIQDLPSISLQPPFQWVLREQEAYWKYFGL